MQVMAMRNTSKYNNSVIVSFDELCSKFGTPVTVRLEHVTFNWNKQDQLHGKTHINTLKLAKYNWT